MLLEVGQSAPFLQVASKTKTKPKKKADTHPLLPRVESAHWTVYYIVIYYATILYYTLYISLYLYGITYDILAIGGVRLFDGFLKFSDPSPACYTVLRRVLLDVFNMAFPTVSPSSHSGCWSPHVRRRAVLEERGSSARTM